MDFYYYFIEIIKILIIYKCQKIEKVTKFFKFFIISTKYPTMKTKFMVRFVDFVTD